MKPILFQLLFILSLFASCQTKSKQVNTNTPKKIKTERSKLFTINNYSEEKIKVADFIDEYLNIMFDSTRERRNHHWSSNILTAQQDHFLKNGVSREYLLHYPPKLLGIRALENNQYIVKIAFHENGFPFKIMNVKIAFDGLNRPYFIDLLGEHLKEFEKVVSDNCTFYYSLKVKRDEKLELKTISFNNELAELFDTEPIAVSIIALNDLRDYCNTLGYEYFTILNYDNQTGGIALPKENLIFSANNSPYYPHELVHLYIARHNAHYWFDEGLATYLGGSVEYPLTHHLTKVANAMDTLDFTKLPENTILDDDTNLKYTLGGLFCKLAMEEYGGKESLFKLLNSGKEKEDFWRAIEDVFSVKKDKMDAFVRKKLLPYRDKE